MIWKRWSLITIKLPASQYLIGENNVGGKWRKFWEGDEIISPTKHFPDILSTDQNFYPIYLTPTETFTKNFILQPKIKYNFFWITVIDALNVELQNLFSS